MKLIIWCSLLLSIGYHTYAQDYSVLKIDSTLLAHSDVVVRLEEHNFIVSQKHKASYSVKEVKTYLNKEKWDGNIYANYDKIRKIKSFKIKVYDLLGNIILEPKKKEINDYASNDGFSMYTDNRVQVYELSNLNPPFTIEKEITYQINGIQYYPSWYIQDFDTSIEKASYTLKLPLNFNIEFKSKLIDLEPKLVLNDSDKTYTWSVQNLASIEKETYIKANKDLLPRINIAPHQLQIGSFEGSFKDWNSYGHFLTDLNKNRNELSPELKSKIHKLCDPLESDFDKINAVYSYLKENTRYVSVQLGIGGWQTFPASYVEKNNFGDCKALSNYMMSMLAEIGILSNSASIYSGKKPFEISSDIVDIGFNHVILYIPSEDLFVECTSSNFPLGYLGSNTENRKAVLYDGTQSRLIKTKKTKASENLKKSTIQVQIKENGQALINGTDTLLNHRHEYFRYLDSQLNETEIQKKLQDNFPFSFKNAKKLEFENSINKPLSIFKYEFETNEISSNAGSRTFVSINPFSPIEINLKKNNNRKLDLFIPLNKMDNSTINLKIPENYSIESIPKDIVIKNEFLEYSLQIIALNDNQYEIKRSLKLENIDVEANRFEEIRKMFNKLKKVDNSKFVFKSK